MFNNIQLRATILHSQNSIPNCCTILFIVGWFSDMFRSDLTGHPQGIVCDTCSVSFNLFLEFFVYVPCIFYGLLSRPTNAQHIYNIYIYIYIYEQYFTFNCHGSVHRNNYSDIYPTRCNFTQFILSGNCSTCFVWYLHPSSGAQTTVSTASGICHTVTAICRYRGRVGTGLSVLWVAITMRKIPDAVDTVVCAPEDGWRYHPKHVEQFPD